MILSDAEFVQQLNLAGYIEPLDAGDYPFDDMLHADFTKLPGHWDGDTLFSMIVRFGHLGVSYNTTPSRPKKRPATPVSGSRKSPARSGISTGACQPLAR